MRLPLRLAVHPLSPTLAPPDRPDRAAALDILVVEDNPTNRLVMEEMLRHLGHQVTLAVDGTDGVRQAASRRFDTVLMDISMPVMDGLTATRLIRTESPSKGARILAVTAHTLPADIERFREAGMDGCLTKPIRTADLEQALAGGTATAAAPMTLLPLVSRDRLSELRQALGPDGAAEAIRSYLVDMERVFATLSTPGQSVPVLTAACHEAAGASATIGAAQLHASFAALERLQAEVDQTDLVRAVDEAERLFSRTAAQPPCCGRRDSCGQNRPSPPFCCSIASSATTAAAPPTTSGAQAVITASPRIAARSGKLVFGIR